MTLPLTMGDGSPFPARDLTIFLAGSVILISLLAASIGLPSVLRGVDFPDEPEDRRKEDRAREVAANAAIAAIEQAQIALMSDSPEADLYPQAAARVIALYQHRLKEHTEVDEGRRFRKIDSAEKELRMAALQAERKAIFNLARHDHISDEISRKLVREVDLSEARFR
jgi:CPA1 family monovalent cation:H+ antiporter